MKIRIVDLMDYYYGDDAKPDRVAVPGEETREHRSRRGDVVKMSRRQRPLLVAAALLLVVTGGLALRLGLGHSPDGGQAMSEGSSFVESIQETMRPELSTAAPESSVELEGTAPQIASDLLQPSVIEGEWDAVENIFCAGNLFYLNDSYYTMTDSGPEQLEMQNLTTTVDFHGTWEVDIDYTVIDGELVFRNNTDKNDYTIVDGEKMNWVEYQEWKWEQMGVSEDIPLLERPEVDLSEVEWITPQVAIAEPLAGSADTVQLSVRRTDLSYIDNLTYPFFYNIFTGEITDPLANVPELHDRGSLGTVRFNSSLTRALVEIWGEPVYSDGSSGKRTYVCDLVTGEMTWVIDLIKPFLPENATFEQYDPEVGLDGSLWDEGSCIVWADDDTLMLEMFERIPLEVAGSVRDYGPDEEVPEEIWDPWERHSWLYAYNMVDGTIRYQLKDMKDVYRLQDFCQPYLHAGEYDAGTDTSSFYTIDTATGAAYALPEVRFSSSSRSVETRTGTVRYEQDGEVYWIDDTQMAWVKLSDYIAVPAGEITDVQMFTDDWLCLFTADQACFYHIPDDLPMTPLTAQ